MDDFRLGVQKCQKTIDDGVGNAGKTICLFNSLENGSLNKVFLKGIFQMEGLDMLFRMLTVAAGKFY